MWFRIATRVQCYELVFLSGLAAVYAIVTGVLGWQLSQITHRHAVCFAPASFGGAGCPDAQASVAGLDRLAETVLWAGAAAPLVVGTFLGAGIVAREIESNNAQLSWSLSVARVRWFAARTLPVAVLAVILLAAVGVAGEWLQSARLGGADPGYVRYQERGIPVVVRGIVILAAALLVGTWLGRTLPTLIVTVLFVAALFLGAGSALDSWRRTEGTVVLMGELTTTPELASGFVLERLSILPDGSTSNDRRVDRLPVGTRFDGVRVLSSASYWTWIVRETIVGVVATGGMVMATLALLERRRPV